MFLRDESNINVIKYKIENFEEVDDLSIRMQQLNDIKGLLTFGRTDNILIYAVSGLIPVLDYIKSSIDGDIVENLKCQYLEIKESVKDYMIPEEELILNYEMAFVDEEGNLKLPCVPTNFAHLESRAIVEFEAILKMFLPKIEVEKPKKVKKQKEPKQKNEHKFFEKLKENLKGKEKDDIFDFSEDDVLPEGISVIAVRRTEEEYPLLFGPDIIGTDEGKCSICFAGNEDMEKEHSSITLSKGKYYIADLNSKSGTFLNGQQLEPGKTYELSSADLIYIAGEEMVFSRRI